MAPVVFRLAFECVRGSREARTAAQKETPPPGDRQRGILSLSPLVKEKPSYR